MRFLLSTFIGLLVAALACTSAWAPTNYALQRAWVTNGSVNAIARSGNTIYLGGDFTRIGPPTGHGAAISRATGQPDLAFPEVGGGAIRAVISDGQDRWYIGGRFTYVGGLWRPNLAHILADKTVDPSFNATAGDPLNLVEALALAQSTLYVGGRFASMGGRTRRGIAAVSAATGRATA